MTRYFSIPWDQADNSTTRRWVRLLRDVIALAKRVEGAFWIRRRPDPVQIAALGCLIRARRSAEAILKLGVDNEYEARAILRGMVELYINLRWILLRQRKQRAKRFLFGTVLSRLRIIEKTPAEHRDRKFREGRAKLIRMRASVRHLYRKVGRKGKLRWFTWAHERGPKGNLRDLNIADRLAEVVRADGKLLGMELSYSYFSTVVHGDPYSLDEVLDVRGGRLVPRRNVRGGDAAIALAAASLRDLLAIAIKESGVAYTEELRRITERFDANRS